jgi:hypothetical protein
MNDKESPIHSTSVLLGTSDRAIDTPENSENGPQKTLQPWVMLICSDLGFISKTPQKISAATLNDLFKNNSVLISGTVASGLPEDIAPFYIEYPVGDIKDFSPSVFSEKLPLLKKLKNAAAILDAIFQKKIPASDGLRQITLMDLPQTIVRQLGTIAISGDDVHRTYRQPSQTSKVDSILSMMDVEVPEAASNVPSQPTDFVAALTEGGKAEFSSAAVLNCKNSIDKLIAVIGSAVAAQPFFAAAASSWNALKILLKTAGRNRDLHFYLHSAPFDAAQRHFADALGSCASSGIPDLVVWDYPVTVDNASMQQLEQIGAIADQYKSEVLTSIYYRDDLYGKILDGEPLRTVIGQPAYIPLRRLQTSGSSRCLVLCAPDATVQRSSGDNDQTVSGAWLLALQWTLSFVENSSPFHLQNSSVMALDGFAFPKLQQETVSDSYRHGITVLKPNGITSPRVLLGDADSPYGSLLFNLMVNRTARLAAMWIGEQDISFSCEQAAPALAAYLSRQLNPYNIIPSEDSISVTVENGQSLKVMLDSDVSVAGFPARFEFSFGYRGQ